MRDGDAGLHVEHAGAVQPAVRSRVSGMRVELADRPDRVEVSEQQDLRRAAAKLGQQMIAALRSGQPRHAAADRLEPRRELGAAAIDRGLVGGRRFERDERLDGLEQPVVARRGRNRGGL